MTRSSFSAHPEALSSSKGEGAELISPGAYLRKRREAAGVAPAQVAAMLAGLPYAIRDVDHGDVARLMLRLEEAEADRDNFTVLQASLVRNCFAFDIEVYEALLLLFMARRAPHLAAGVERPHICRDCACSWEDACMTDRGPCAWSEEDPDLCTACERAARLEAELTAAPDPFALRDDPLVLSSSKHFAAARELGRPVHAGAGPAEALQRSLQP